MCALVYSCVFTCHSYGAYRVSSLPAPSPTPRAELGAPAAGPSFAVRLGSVKLTAFENGDGRRARAPPPTPPPLPPSPPPSSVGLPSWLALLLSPAGVVAADSPLPAGDGAGGTLLPPPRGGLPPPSPLPSPPANARTSLGRGSSVPRGRHNNSSAAPRGHPTRAGRHALTEGAGQQRRGAVGRRGGTPAHVGDRVVNTSAAACAAYE